eukprot:TRINITY_DN13807_c0_g1_i1.p1 TRINITY_DN13807_c0_g1~~TRINITY_DN13807_c0_g1_i1.p1  ORF type:complete len:156 (-),score=21.86 TRINITY_DN13807_c0_g1_i1:157-603(-)
MALIGLEQISRPGKLADLLFVVVTAILSNTFLLIVILAIFGILVGSFLQAMKTAVFIGMTVASLGSVLVQLRYGIVPELEPNASLGLGLVLADIVAFAGFSVTHIVFLPWDLSTFLLAAGIAAGSAVFVAVPVSGALLDPNDRVPKLD